MSTTPSRDLGPDAPAWAVIVLGAIDALDEKLEVATGSMRTYARQRFRVSLAVVAVVVLLLTAGGVGYVHTDKVGRCERRAEIAQAVRGAFAAEHEAIPQALLDGFGDEAKPVVDVIEERYAATEAQLARDFPIPDCSGFMP